MQLLSAISFFMGGMMFTFFIKEIIWKDYKTAVRTLLWVAINVLIGVKFLN